MRKTLAISDGRHFASTESTHDCGGLDGFGTKGARPSPWREHKEEQAGQGSEDDGKKKPPNGRTTEFARCLQGDRLS
jgi:hypothetical protein